MQEQAYLHLYDPVYRTDAGMETDRVPPNSTWTGPVVEIGKLNNTFPRGEIRPLVLADL